MGVNILGGWNMQEHDVANDSVNDSDAEKIKCGHYRSIGVIAAISKEENAPDVRDRENCAR